MRRTATRCTLHSISLFVTIGVALLSPALGAATITGIAKPSHNPDPLDAFDHATITASSPATSGSYTSSHGDLFGRTQTTYPGESGYLLFSNSTSAAALFVEFNLAAPVTLTGYRLYAWEGDGTTAFRNMTGVSLFARSTPGPFTAGDLVSTTPVHAPYRDSTASGGYGSTSIVVADAFAPVSARYFRLEVLPVPATFNNGTRLIELDAVVPEPLLLAPLAILGFALRRQPL